MGLEEKKFWLGLKLLPKLSNYCLRLLEQFGTPEGVWNATADQLSKLNGITISSASEVARERETIDLDIEYQKLLKADIELIALNDIEYPPLLKDINYPPPVLFVKGDLIKRYARGIAIVGCRKATAYGRKVASELAASLSSEGVTIISGLARGVDRKAHQGALEGEGGTIGVCGNGLDIVYPPENRALSIELETHGSLISEYPMGTPPLSRNFPCRNRIISGLASAVVVVEAGEKSGALITADFALEQGREVFAVPGSIFNPASRGSHQLIRFGAAPVETAKDVLEAFGWASREAPAALPGLTPQEHEILEILGFEPKHMDELVPTLKLDVSTVASILTILEVKGYIKQDLGKRYLRVQ